MNEIVFLSPNTKEPFTTSDIIAEKTNNNYRSVQRIIETQRKRLEKFGIMRFQITLSGRVGNRRQGAAESRKTDTVRPIAGR